MSGDEQEVPPVDTTRLRALFEADRDERTCPECGEPAFVSDCWQIEALDQAPVMLDEIDALRAELASLRADHVSIQRRPTLIQFADLGWAHAKLDEKTNTLHLHTPPDTGEVFLPAAFIGVHGRENLRALADLLAPYGTARVEAPRRESP